MADWDGKYISPYAEHGKKSEQVKKITVSIPIKVLEILTNERTRRQLKSLRHATNSELLCEAFLHAFTGQPLPTDADCTPYNSVKTRVTLFTQPPQCMPSMFNVMVFIFTPC